MKNTMPKIALVGLLASAVVGAPNHGFAQDNKKEKPAIEKKEAPKSENKKGRGPFNGKISAVDKIAKTITVGERIFQITSETKLMKGGKPATLDDAAVGEAIGGNFQKGDDGKLNAKTVHLGPKPQAEGEAKKAADAKKEKKLK